MAGSADGVVCGEGGPTPGELVPGPSQKECARSREEEAVQEIPVPLTSHHWTQGPRGWSVPTCPVQPAGSVLGHLPGEPQTLWLLVATCPSDLLTALASSCPPGLSLYFLGEKSPQVNDWRPHLSGCPLLRESPGGQSSQVGSSPVLRAGPALTLVVIGDHIRIDTCNVGLRHRPHPGQAGCSRESWEGKVEAYRRGPAGGDRTTSPRGCQGAGAPLLPPGG